VCVCVCVFCAFVVCVVSCSLILSPALTSALGGKGGEESVFLKAPQEIRPHVLMSSGGQVRQSETQGGILMSWLCSVVAREVSLPKIVQR
jgi:hypothetical protein